MSEIKHTPGPWLLRSKNDSVWTQPPEGSAYTFGNHIFTFHDEDGPTSDDLSLILAAPELFDALRDMLAGWKYIRGTHGDLYGVGWGRAQDKAEAALAKARGES